MPTLTLELPQHQAQTALNLRRWAELLADSELTRFEGRVETDRHGHIIMSPPPAPNHGSFQTAIGSLLDRHMRTGRVLTECPISTADGVKAADVAWASPECMRELGNRVCFPKSPEICVEVLSPSNTEAEIRERVNPSLRGEQSRPIGFPRRDARCSLSLRERVRVRGNVANYPRAYRTPPGTVELGESSRSAGGFAKSSLEGRIARRTRTRTATRRTTRLGTETSYSSCCSPWHSTSA